MTGRTSDLVGSSQPTLSTQVETDLENLHTLKRTEPPSAGPALTCLAPHEAATAAGNTSSHAAMTQPALAVNSYLNS